MSEISPSQKGGIAEAKVLAALVELGVRVSVPFQDDSPYDFVVDVAGGLFRTQVKWAPLGKRGSIVVPTCWRGDGRANRQVYSDDRAVDVFIAYCPETDTCYLIPHSEATDRATSLRVVPAKNNQSDGVRLASEYELSRMIEKLTTIPSTGSPRSWQSIASQVTHRTSGD